MNLTTLAGHAALHRDSSIGIIILGTLYVNSNLMVKFILWSILTDEVAVTSNKLHATPPKTLTAGGSLKDITKETQSFLKHLIMESMLISFNYCMEWRPELWIVMIWLLPYHPSIEKFHATLITVFLWYRKICERPIDIDIPLNLKLSIINRFISLNSCQVLDSLDVTWDPLTIRSIWSPSSSQQQLQLIWSRRLDPS